MSDVTVTEADRKAAEALARAYYKAWYDVTPEDEYHDGFAAMVDMLLSVEARAVQAERKRCVEVLRSTAAKSDQSEKSLRECGFDGAAADVRAWKATALKLADQLEKRKGK